MRPKQAHYFPHMLISTRHDILPASRSGPISYKSQIRFNILTDYIEQIVVHEHSEGGISELVRKIDYVKTS